VTLHGQRVLVVGASSGIGRAIAVAASAAGARVALGARRGDRLADAVAECGPNAIACEADVREPTACASLVATATDTFGGLDAVVYAAGVSNMALVVDTDAAEWRRILETNVIGAALVFAAASKQLAAHHGRFLVLSSISVHRPKHGLVPYAASKAALGALIQGLRTEHPDVELTVVTVGPTGPAEFGRDFDPVLSEQLMAAWRAGGFLAPGQMTTSDVADRIVQCLSSPMRTEELVLLPRP
jgi:NAD(P)-dependent dehydrogenase (short-subunit alcohol dehydrogenase family)